MIHTHTCVDCQVMFLCDSTMVPDHDGSEPHCEMEWRGGPLLCVDCAEDRQQAIRDEAKAENDR